MEIRSNFFCSCSSTANMLNTPSSSLIFFLNHLHLLKWYQSFLNCKLKSIFHANRRSTGRSNNMNQGSKGTAMDHNDELYLHHSDHPNYSLSAQLLTDSNYNHWRRSVEVSLIAKNKLNFINNILQPPEEGSARYQLWQRCNSMVISWLLHQVRSDIAETLLTAIHLLKFGTISS